MKKIKLRLIIQITFIRFVYILLLVGFFNPSFSQATEESLVDKFLVSAGIPDDIFTINTLHGWREQKNGIEVHYFGIDIQLQEGWKTYWRKTGNTGFPMSITWEERLNFHKSIIHWPNPTIVTMAGEPTIGYADRVVFPLEIHPLTPGIPISGVGTLNLGVCREVCIPVFEVIALNLFPTKEKNYPELHTSLTSKPQTFVSSFHPDVLNCNIDNESVPPTISTRIDSSFLDLNQPFLAIYESSVDPVFFYKPETGWGNNESRIIYSHYESLDGSDIKLDPSKIMLTIISEEHTYEIQGC